MATRVSLLPDRLVLDDGYTPTGTSDRVVAVNDASDSTYIRKAASSTSYRIGYDVGTSTLSTAIPWRVRSCTRLTVTSGDVAAGWGSTAGLTVAGYGRAITTTAVAIATVTNRARTSNVVTLTTSAAHNLTTEDTVYVSGVASGFNGSFEVASTPSSTTFTYVATGSNVASTASSGTVEQVNLVSDWMPFRSAFASSITDQAGVDAITTTIADAGSSTARALIYKTYVDLETTTAPTTTSVTAAGIGPSVAVTAATQSGTSVTVTVASHSFNVGDTVYLTGVTGLTLGTNQGVVTATTGTSVTFTVSGSATATGTVSSAVLMPRVTTNNTPTVGWTYSQSDTIPQYGYQVAVHSASTGTPGTGASLVWGSGQVVNASAVNATVAEPLSNATTYWVYVRTFMRATVDGVPASSINTNYFSAWSTATQVRVDLSPPSVPTVTTSWQSATQSVSITATGSTYSAGTQLFTLQASYDGGTTWAAVRGSTLSSSTSTTLTAVDYETPRSITARYRAQAVGYPTGLTDVLSSAWSTASTVTTTSDGTHWLKDPSTPANNVGSVAVIADPSFTVEERVEVLRPLGRSDAVVVAGAIGEEDGSLEIHAASEATWTALKNLLYAQRTLLWQDAFDAQRYIRITSRSFTRLGARGAPRYSAQVQYVEVAAP